MEEQAPSVLGPWRAYVGPRVLPAGRAAPDDEHGQRERERGQEQWHPARDGGLERPGVR
ncbi:hypothetical protein D3C74_459390 [compost metagenome]